MRKCKNCGRENDDSFKFCLDCGQPLDDQGNSAQHPATQPGPEPSSAQAKSSPVQAASSAPSATAQPAAAAATPPPESAPPAASSTAPSAAANGQPVQSCPACKKPVQPTDAFCPHCGNRLSATAGKSTMFLHTTGPVAQPRTEARLVLIRPDGSEGSSYTLAEGKTIIGRTQGDIQFSDDPYMSPRHAELTFESGNLTITDLHSLNGVYIRLTEPAPVKPGSCFRIGRQLLRLELPGEFQPVNIEPREGDDSLFWGSPPPPVWARLVQMLEGGKIGEIHLLVKPEVMLGREEGDIRFPEDGFISSRHCVLVNQQGDCTLTDLGSSNGTFLKIDEPRQLKNGDRIQVGTQVFKVVIT